jgi:hypothetical protein
VSVERTSFASKKIYWASADDLVRQVNLLMAKEIISISAAIPDETTTLNCSRVYYEFYL